MEKRTSIFPDYIMVFWKMQEKFQFLFVSHTYSFFQRSFKSEKCLFS